jgi:alpha-beta hydrolase superfamily lysophospholipase
VQAYERATKKRYIWSDYTRQLAHRTDAIERAADIARDRPAVLIVHGTDDATLPAQDAIALRDALAPFYRETASKRLRLELIDGLSHGWAESAHGDELRREIAAWFKVSG